MATERIGDPPLEVLAEIRGVVAKAKAGDASVLPQLRELLDRHPDLSAHYGSLAKHAEAAWVALAGGNNLYMRETFTRSADAQRAELTRPGATPIERLLVARVVACSMELNYLSATEADALAAGDTFRQLQFHARRVERAQRMYLVAMGALTAFQRLMPLPNQETQTRELAPCSEEHQQPQTEAVAAQADRVIVAVEMDEPCEQEPAEHERVRAWAGG